MRRLLLALVLLGLATWLIPGLRQRAAPRVESTSEWMGETLEGPLSPVVSPYRRIQTESTMGEVGRLLVRNRNRGQAPPLPDEFTEYLASRGMSHRDGWGRPLMMRQEADSVAVISAGADGEYETDDDIIARIRYEAPRSPYRGFR